MWSAVWLEVKTRFTSDHPVTTFLHHVKTKSGLNSQTHCQGQEAQRSGVSYHYYLGFR